MIAFNSDLTFSEALIEATERLIDSGVETASLDARVLLRAVANLSAELLLSERDKIIPKTLLKTFWTSISRRAKGEPIAYIVGSKEFWSLNFSVNSSTLIPRPESEVLVEAVIRHKKKENIYKPKILDLGSGSGCLLLSILSDCPDAIGMGIDINFKACEVARENARYNCLDHRSLFCVGDWAQPVDQLFDFVITNPPYIAEYEKDFISRDVIGFEPHSALFAGPKGVECYFILSNQIKRILSSNASVFVEVGAKQSKEVKEIFSKAGFITCESWKDLAGIDRCIRFEARN